MNGAGGKAIKNFRPRQYGDGKAASRLRSTLTELKNQATKVTKDGLNNVGGVLKNVGGKVGSVLKKAGSVFKAVPVVGSVLGGIVEFFFDDTDERLEALEESAKCTERRMQEVENQVDVKNLAESNVQKLEEHALLIANNSAAIEENSANIATNKESIEDLYSKHGLLEERFEIEKELNSLRFKKHFALAMSSFARDVKDLKRKLTGDIFLGQLCSGGYLDILDGPEWNNVALALCSCGNLARLYSSIKSSWRAQVDMYLTLTDHLNEDIIPSVSTPGFADKTLWDPTRLMLDVYFSAATFFAEAADSFKAWGSTAGIRSEANRWKKLACSKVKFNPKKPFNGLNKSKLWCRTETPCVPEDIIGIMMSQLAEVLTAAESVKATLQRTQGNPPVFSFWFSRGHG